MHRYRIVIEYHGGDFHGWQRQPTDISVQEVIEAALLQAFGYEVKVYGAGRTDSGVHAVAQVAHFDLKDNFPSAKLPWLINGLRIAGRHGDRARLSVLSAHEVDKDFHARFSARQRHYVYRLTTRRSPPQLIRDLVWSLPYGLDVAAMTEAASYLIGHHDFTTFRASQCQAPSPCVTMKRVKILQAVDRVDMIFSSRSFLHSQVRSMAGSLVEVGRRKFPPQWMGDILAQRDRKACGPVAPGKGLYLLRVDYEDDLAYPERESLSSHLI